MNKVILMGRLTRDPEMAYSQSANVTAIARFSVAVDRKFKREGEPDADFFSCVAFGKQAEFIESYLHKGTKIVLSGRIQNDIYTNRERQTVHSVCIITEDIEFAESKASSDNNNTYVSRPEPGVNTTGNSYRRPAPSGASNEWLNIPEAMGEKLPF